MELFEGQNFWNEFHKYKIFKFYGSHNPKVAIAS